jgi:hypothetical protein
VKFAGVLLIRLFGGINLLGGINAIVRVTAASMYLARLG